MEFIVDEPCKTKISKPKDKEIKLFKKGGRNGKKKRPLPKCTVSVTCGTNISSLAYVLLKHENRGGAMLEKIMVEKIPIC